MFCAAVHLDRERAAVGMAQCGLERFGKALLGVGAHLEAVDHDFDGVLDVLLEFGQRVDFVHRAVDAHAHETLRAQLVEQVDLLAFAPDDQRRQDHQPGVFRQLQHVIDHLRHALRRERDVVIGAVRVADAREQAGAGNRESR